MKKNVNSKNFIIVLVLLLGFVTNCLAQKNQTSGEELIPLNRNENGNFMSEKELFKDNFRKIEGTFQIQILKSEYTVPITESLFDKIQTLRKENEDVIIYLDENSNLFLPSRNMINSLGFKKLDLIKVVNK